MPRRNWRRPLRRFLAAFLGALVLIAISYAVILAWHHKLVRDIEARGESLNPADFNPPPVSPEDNGAALLLQAMILAAEEPEEYGEFTRKAGLTENAETLKHPEEIAWRTLEEAYASKAHSLNTAHIVVPAYRSCQPELEALLLRRSRALSLADEGLSQPECQFELHLEDGVVVTLPHLAYMRYLARLYRLRAVSRAANGDMTGALADCSTIVRLARTLEKEPLAVCQLVRMSIDRIAMSAMHAIREFGTPASNALERFAHMLAEEAADFDIARMLQAERAVLYDMVTDPAPSGAEAPWPAARPMQLLLLTSMDDMVAVASLPYPERLKRALDLAPESKASPNPLTHPIRATREAVLPAQAGILQTHAVFVAQCRAESIAHQLLADMGRGDAFPDSLAQFPMPLRTDPLTGADLSTLRTDDVFIVYSVGMNAQDDRGAWENRNDERSIHVKDDIAAVVPLPKEDAATNSKG